MHFPSLPHATYDGVAAPDSDVARGKWLPSFADWYRDLAGGQERLLDADLLCWIASLVVHVVVLVTLGLLAAPRPPAEDAMTVVVPLSSMSAPAGMC